MYRIGYILIAVLAAAFGLLVGALNHTPVTLELLAFQLHWPLGLLVLCGLSLGVLTGLMLAWLLWVIPQKISFSRKLKALRSEQGPLIPPPDD